MAKKLDIQVGEKFGLLTIITEAGLSKSRKYRRFLVSCDCGNELIVSLPQLRSGKTKSCGCLRRKPSVQRKEAGEASFNKVFYFYKRNAARKNLEFHIGRARFKELISCKCFYCGSPPKQFFKRYDYNGHFYYNGLDRIDNLRGYTEDNILVCCTICNRAKSDMPFDLFINYLKSLGKHLQSYEL